MCFELKKVSFEKLKSQKNTKGGVSNWPYEGLLETKKQRNKQWQGPEARPADRQGVTAKKKAQLTN